MAGCCSTSATGTRRLILQLPPTTAYTPANNNQTGKVLYANPL